MGWTKWFLSVRGEDFDEWIKRLWPEAKIIVETGAGETYGEPGDKTAHIGPDMQADVVGVHNKGEASAELYIYWL